MTALLLPVQAYAQDAGVAPQRSDHANGAAAPAAVQLAQADASGEVSFDIGAQSLDEALTSLADQADIELLFTSDQVSGLESQGLSGSYSTEEALRRLLAGTGLRHRFVDSDTVTLEAASAAGTEGPATVMGPVVVSVTRTETPVSDLTRSVTVVTREDIEQQEATGRNLGDILSKTVPGFSQSTEALTDFGQTLRGRTFLTLIDGIPQSTPLRDGRRSLNTIDADAIERVEVVRGGSAVYGFGASGGLVNIITRRPEPGEINGESEAGIEFSTTHPDDSIQWHTNHQVSGRVDQFDYLFNGTFVQRSGFFDAEGDRIPADPFGVQGGLADTNEFNLLGKLGYEFDGGNQRVELSANHFHILQDSNFAGLGTGNPATGQKTPAVRGNINAELPGTTNTIANLQYRNDDVFGSTVKTQAYYGDLTTRFSKFPGFPQVEITSEKLGARLTVDTPVDLGPVGFNAIWGTDYLHDETAQPALDGPTQTPAMEQDAIAGFLQLEVPISDWAQLRGGLRHEAISVDVDDVLNRQGVFVTGGTLNFNETLYNASATVFLTDNAEVFGGFSQGFSLADIGRAITDTTATSASQLQSEVQTTDNYEVGIRGHGDMWDASITGFFSESENGTTFNPNLEITKTPERIYGIEVEANVEPIERLRLGGTLTWQRGRVDLNDNGNFEQDLPNTRIPPEKVTGYVEYSPLDWWTTRLQGLYSGHRKPSSTQFGGSEVDQFVAFDLYNSFDTGYGKIEVGVENLFNEDYFPVLNQAGNLAFALSKAPGRTVSVRYSVEW